MKQLRWITPGPPRPPPEPRPARAELDDNLALLYPYCGSCHAADSRHPPGFLAPNETLARVTACAPRIWHRLAGWRQADRRSRAPMPPPAVLPLDGGDPHAWPHSEHYQSLLQAVEDLLVRQADPVDWRSAGYDSLPVCSGDA